MAPHPTSGGWFCIIHKKSGQHLATDGQRIYMERPNTTVDRQQWTFCAAGDGYHNLKPRVRHTHLDSNGRDLYMGADENVGTHNHYQQWKFVHVEGDWFNIVHRVSGIHLDSDAGATRVYMSSRENNSKHNDFQQWRFVRAG
jgi:hypothetical protein